MGEEIKNQAAYVVNKVVDHAKYVVDATNSIKELVSDLLNQSECVCKERPKPKFRITVQGVERPTRKRKQVFPKSTTSAGSPVFEDNEENREPNVARPKSPPSVPIKRSKGSPTKSFPKAKRSVAILRNSKDLAPEVPSKKGITPLYLPPVEYPEPRSPSEMLNFLEDGRKNMRFDGLYRWVLWKETLSDVLKKDVENPHR